MYNFMYACIYEACISAYILYRERQSYGHRIADSPHNRYTERFHAITRRGTTATPDRQRARRERTNKPNFAITNSSFQMSTKFIESSTEAGIYEIKGTCFPV